MLLDFVKSERSRIAGLWFKRLDYYNSGVIRKEIDHVLVTVAGDSFRTEGSSRAPKLPEPTTDFSRLP